MKRLIKKNEDLLNNEVPVENNAENQIDTLEQNKAEENLVELDQLSEADVRHERCPVCKYNPLERKDGFKACPRCENIFKVLNGVGYMVAK